MQIPHAALWQNVVSLGLLVMISGISLSESRAAGDDFEGAPISYSDSKPDNCISRLQETMDRGELTLTRDGEQGYLKSFLKALDVPVESQTLVFSKTSLQIRRITPRTPRALYFSDDVYVGYCQGGDVLEVSAVDRNLGTVFYTLDQRGTEGVPRIERRTDQCLVCHASSRTEGVPGHVVRSLHVSQSGYPVLAAGSRNVNHTTPFHERWGGWYVTGLHGSQKHMGNLIVDEARFSGEADNSAGHNTTSLTDYFDTDRYLTPHSDIVALMVLEHQVLVHNRITSANFGTRLALDYDAMMSRELKFPEGQRLESTTRRIRSAGDKLVDCLLFVDEAPLSEAVTGTSGFAEKFAAAGPRDSQGRSLRDFDMTRRMFRYPCSYLIYSEAFRSLPPDVHTYVWMRLRDVLSGHDQSPRFAHLSADDRAAITEILNETVPDAPAVWRESVAPETGDSEG